MNNYEKISKQIKEEHKNSESEYVYNDFEYQIHQLRSKFEDGDYNFIAYIDLSLDFKNDFVLGELKFYNLSKAIRIEYNYLVETINIYQDDKNTQEIMILADRIIYIPKIYRQIIDLGIKPVLTLELSEYKEFMEYKEKALE